MLEPVALGHETTPSQDLLFWSRSRTAKVLWRSVALLLEIRTTVRRKKIPIVKSANTGISSTGTVNGTQDVNPFEGVFKHEGIIIEVFAVTTSATHLIACQ